MKAISPEAKRVLTDLPPHLLRGWSKDERLRAAGLIMAIRYVEALKSLQVILTPDNVIDAAMRYTAYLRGERPH